ncbi:hypothetical protein JHK82_052764 [Glycine max]|nr:hypothetical protein JHK86_052614 [Glycine max]KAG4926982.1 hypothetical protein JHK85_053468 [Glycine max]KAG5082609.1 hypothetical protein JHK84_052647 [Glycine max]KAG5085367.1 hypothetical protein JHK82_052764 [Glycine max]
MKDMKEGFPTNKPPLFRGIKYDYWKERMIAHFESIHIDLWDVVENDTLTVTYKGTSQVKRNKLSLLTCNHELSFMKEGEDIQCMFGHFQTILNELRSLGRTYDNYDYIDKILRSLSRKWRP